MIPKPSALRGEMWRYSPWRCYSKCHTFNIGENRCQYCILWSTLRKKVLPKSTVWTLVWMAWVWNLFQTKQGAFVQLELWYWEGYFPWSGWNSTPSEGSGVQFGTLLDLAFLARNAFAQLCLVHELQLLMKKADLTTVTYECFDCIQVRLLQDCIRAQLFWASIICLLVIKICASDYILSSIQSAGCDL